jgi:hypothetical protein
MIKRYQLSAFSQLELESWELGAGNWKLETGS